MLLLQRHSPCDIVASYVNLKPCIAERLEILTARHKTRQSGTAWNGIATHPAVGQAGERDLGVKKSSKSA